MTDPVYEWRGGFESGEANALHAEAFEHEAYPTEQWDWAAICERHSLGWVTARLDGRLVGFLNVVWDGAVHAWLQDEMVAIDARRLGIGAALVLHARSGAAAAGCEWLHVDFDDHLRPFYFDALGFVPTNAGLMDLAQEPRP